MGKLYIKPSFANLHKKDSCEYKPHLDASSGVHKKSEINRRTRKSRQQNFQVKLE